MAQTKVDFDTLCKTYETQVYRFIRIRANQEADARDIAQNTWEILQHKLPL